MGVVVRRYMTYIYVDFLIILPIPPSLVLAVFCTAALLLCSFKNVFCFIDISGLTSCHNCFHVVLNIRPT